MLSSSEMMAMEADVRRAFNNAIQRGVFVTDEANASHIDDGMTDNVEEWMYMGNEGRDDAFKNKITREYIRVPR